MSEFEIVVDDDVLTETKQIATQIGLTLDEVLKILLRKFNAERGFFFSLSLKEIEMLRVQHH